MFKPLLICILSTILATSQLNAQIQYPGKDPGKAVVKVKPGVLILENNALRIIFTSSENNLNIKSFQDKKTKYKIDFDNLALFELNIKDAPTISSNNFTLIHAPVVSSTEVDLQSRTYSGKIQGKKISAHFEYPQWDLKVHWECTLKDGSNYIHQVFNFTSNNPAKFSRITLLKLPAEIGVRKEGKVDGSPVICRNMFFAVEHPLSKTEENSLHFISYMPRLMSKISTVWGTTPDNQLRRGFLYYLERERSQPYHHFLHYNSWYDISYSDRKFNESEILDRIKVFGDSLIVKRQTPLKAFLLDDGWDDNSTLWKVHSGFPDGFSNVKKAAESYNSTIGIWFSPIGGYSQAARARIEYGKSQNPPFEVSERGFSLAGPVYYNRLLEVSKGFIKDYNTSIFKFDGIGGGNKEDISLQKEYEALLKLLNELTILKPDLYLSITTHTWPSPYWLFFGDNIWRGGADTGMRGEGTNRQRWITYRDSETYKNIVDPNPLFPINSLMLCGICIADLGMPGKFEMNDKDISDEIWSFFATGTNLQELYINPHKLNTANWDCLAQAAKWASEYESVLADTHWVGGDPSDGEVYGFASWSRKKAVLALRNPSDETKTFNVIVRDVFELPSGLKNKYRFYDAKSSSTTVKKYVSSGESFTLTLQPFEVIVLNAQPE